MQVSQEHPLAKFIKENNLVSRDQVAECKAYLVENFSMRPEQMLRELLENRDLKLPSVIDLISSPEPIYGKHLAECSTWWNAGVQALWELQGQGVFIPSDNEVVFSIDSFQLVSGSSNSRRTSTIHLKEFFNPTVRSLHKGIAEPNELILSNSDVYLRNFSFRSMPESVSTDLSQVAECFRRELYLPSLVMLGRAIEGAWISVAESLSDHISDEKERSKFVGVINDGYVGVSGKINAVASIYNEKKYFGKMQHESGVSTKKLGAARQWSEQLLGYRNAIHPSADPVIEFNYESVSVILLSVKSYLRTLDDLLSVAQLPAS